jgi:hypothetical protein
MSPPSAFCSECNPRRIGSTCSFHPFKQERIADLIWGFVAGGAQPDFPVALPEQAFADVPPLRFRDVLHGYRSSWAAGEGSLIRAVSGVGR